VKPASFFMPYLCRLRILRIALVSALWIVPALAQSTATPSQIVQPIDNSVRVTLPGTKPKAIASAQDMGAMSSAQTLRNMVLVLKPSAAQQAALKSELANLYNRNSKSYHQWLTPAQFGAAYGPSAADVAKVEGWLQSQGLTPTAVANGRQWIEFTGSVQQVNTAFATSMHQFALNGQKHYANATDISIPSAITPVVAGVLSLNNFQAQPLHTDPIQVKRNVNGKLAPVNPKFTTNDGNGNYYYYLSPNDFQTIYDETSLIKNGVDGTGISIAIPGRSDIDMADVEAFRQAFGLPQNDPNIIVNGVNPGETFGRDQSESSLDVEWAGAAAPGATINFVVSASTDTTDGVDLSSAYIIDNRISPIMSVSYGLSEALLGPSGNAFYNALWEQAAAEGITVFVSTGDSGTAELDADLQDNGYEAQGPAQYGPSVSGMASTPYDVAVGGTEFNEGGNYPSYWSPNNTNTFEDALGYIPEAAWNEGCDPTLPSSSTNCLYGQTNYNLEGGGGGPSNCSQASVDSQGNETCLGGYGKPSWQTGTGVPSDGVRDIPDVALNASPDDDGYLYCFFGQCLIGTQNGQPVLNQAGVIGGTSASAPSMAGIMALVEQKNGAYQGQADYEFYQLAAKDTAAACDSSTMTQPTLASTCNFHDVTAGNNSEPGMTGYDTATAQWAAGTGYDMSTGLGTVDAANLVANWGSVAATAGSATTLTVDGSTAAHGQPLTIHIHVAAASGSGTPTGDVALMTDKYGSIGDVTLDASGNYSGPVSDLPGGTYNLTAHYNGDSTFTSSDSSPVSLTVSPEDSTVSVSLDVLNFNTGQEVPYTGTLTWSEPLFVTVTVAGKSGQGNATGTVNLLDNGQVVMSGTLTSSGTVAFTTGGGTSYTFPDGSSTLTVQYMGDNSFHASTSAAQTITQQKVQGPTYVSISNYQVPAGQTVFLTALIPPAYNGGGPATGTVQFYDNGQTLGSPMTLATPAGSSEAQVKYAATFTALGTHNITVGYSGDANFAAVSGTDPTYAYSSQVQVVPVTGAATTTTITQNPTTVSYGQSYTYTVKVAPVKASATVPTGQVTIASDGNIFAGPVTLVNGVGTVIMSGDAETAHVYAQYSGDSNYAASTSSMITTTISKVTTPITLTTTAPYVLPGQQTELSVVVTGHSFGQYGYYRPQGTVQFFTSVNGGAGQAVSAPIGLTLPWIQNPMDAIVTVPVTLPTGTNVVTAMYSGDTDFNAETTAPATVVVTAPDFTLNSGTPSLTVSAGGSATTSLSIASVLGFNGNIALACGSGLPAGAACSFSPASLAGGGQSNLTVTMEGPFTQTQAKNDSHKSSGWAQGAELCGLFGLFFAGFARQRRKVMPMLMVLVMAFGFLSGCGGNAGPTATLVQVGSTQSEVASGTSVTFTAQVSVGSQMPTGTVTFYDGATALGNPVALDNGEAALSVSNLAVGTHLISAKYSGDAHHSAAVSQDYYEAVTGTTTLQVVATSGTITHTLNVKLAVQ
jgi:hypothetical protein